MEGGTTFKMHFMDEVLSYSWIGFKIVQDLTHKTIWHWVLNVNAYFTCRNGAKNHQKEGGEWDMNNADVRRSNI